ncbi:MAG: MaoC/PaaZ C-terminal domain-containing protein [Nanoarchaeota archaeon]
MEITREHERRIKRILRRGKTSTRPRAIRLFGTITGDPNNIHRRREYAEASGLPNTPVIGAHISAIGLERALEAYYVLANQRPVELYHSTRFSSPLFPGRKKLGPLEIEDIDEETVLKLPVHRGNFVKATNETRIGRISKKIDTPANPDAGPIFAEVTLTEKGEQAYGRLVRAQPRDHLSPGWLQALFPGTLVRVLNTAYEGDNKDAPMPLNLRMTTHIKQQAEKSPLALEVYMNDRGRRGDLYVYDFYGEIKQGNRVIGVSELKAVSRTPIDLEKIRRVSRIPSITL